MATIIDSQDVVSVTARPWYRVRPGTMQQLKPAWTRFGPSPRLSPHILIFVLKLNFGPIPLHQLSAWELLLLFNPSNKCKWHHKSYQAGLEKQNKPWLGKKALRSSSFPMSPKMCTTTHHVGLWREAIQHGWLAEDSQWKQDRSYAIGGSLC